jgi:long-chain acyl-CoA synthetase
VKAPTPGTAARTDLGTWAAMQPDAEAVVIADVDSGAVERITYGELDASANRLARAFRRAGLRRDDRVAFVLGNEAAVFTVFWAAMRTGLHVVPINRHLLAGEIRYILDDAGVGAVIGSRAGGPAWADATQDLATLRLSLTVAESLDEVLAAESGDPLDNAEEGQLLLSIPRARPAGPRAFSAHSPASAPAKGPPSGPRSPQGSDSSPATGTCPPARSTTAPRSPSRPDSSASGPPPWS